MDDYQGLISFLKGKKRNAAKEAASHATWLAEDDQRDDTFAHDILSQFHHQKLQLAKEEIDLCMILLKDIASKLGTDLSERKEVADDNKTAASVHQSEPFRVGPNAERFQDKERHDSNHDDNLAPEEPLTETFPSTRLTLENVTLRAHSQRISVPTLVNCDSEDGISPAGPTENADEQSQSSSVSRMSPHKLDNSNRVSTSSDSKVGCDNHPNNQSANQGDDEEVDSRTSTGSDELSESMEHGTATAHMDNSPEEASFATAGEDADSRHAKRAASSPRPHFGSVDNQNVGSSSRCSPQTGLPTRTVDHTKHGDEQARAQDLVEKQECPVDDVEKNRLNLDEAEYAASESTDESALCQGDDSSTDSIPAPSGLHFAKPAIFHHGNGGRQRESAKQTRSGVDIRAVTNQQKLQAWSRDMFVAQYNLSTASYRASGGNKEVYEVKTRSINGGDGHWQALSVINGKRTTKEAEEEIEEAVISEISIASSLVDLPSFVTVTRGFAMDHHPFERSQQGNFFCIQSELCDGDLEEYMKTFEAEPPAQRQFVRRLVEFVVSSLVAAEKMVNFRHYDLKLLNILYKIPKDTVSPRCHTCAVQGDERTGFLPPDMVELKLTDLGNASAGNRNDDGKSVTDRQWSTLQNAPIELFLFGNNARQGPELDMWGLGLSMLHVASNGTGPYEEVLEGISCPSDLKDELEALWRHDPTYNIVNVILEKFVDGDENVLYDTLYHVCVVFDIRDEFVKTYKDKYAAVRILAVLPNG